MSRLTLAEYAGSEALKVWKLTIGGLLNSTRSVTGMIYYPTGE